MENSSVTILTPPVTPNLKDYERAETGMLDVRPVLTVILSADHRATDGATGSRFLMAVQNYLGKPELL